MNIGYRLKKRIITRTTTANPWFFLMDRCGGYVSLSARGSVSKFHASFSAFPQQTGGLELYRFIEDIKGETIPTALIHHDDYIEQRSGTSSGAAQETREKFYFLGTTLVYDIENYNGTLELVVDARKIYDFSDQGRIYALKKENGMVVINYTKYTDTTLSQKKYGLVLVFNHDNVQPLNEWVLKEYPFDKSRGSLYQQYVYRAVRLKINGAAKLFFSVGVDEQQARDALQRAQTMPHSQNIFSSSFFTLSPPLSRSSKSHGVEQRLAAACCQKALDDLWITMNSTTPITSSESSSSEGLYAGLPWFFQFWARDEIISSKALQFIGQAERAKKIVFKYLHSIEDDGTLRNHYTHHSISEKNSEQKNSDKNQLKSIDAVGWLFYRLAEMLPSLSKAEQSFVLQQLEKALHGLETSRTEDCLTINQPLETWMDTHYGDDMRAGARIEVQALRLVMYHLVETLYTLQGNKESQHQAAEKIKALQENCREVFWHPPLLYDGKVNGNDDPTIRPNIFLAYYLSPQLLSKIEWEQCFDCALTKLWLSWGGITTIAKDDPLFCDHYTGEDNRSYHRGDSWFWINNLTAICLYRLNAKKYQSYVDTIVKASTIEILWHGALGCHAELSSAKELASQGCFLQAWSCALYLELMHELSE